MAKNSNKSSFRRESEIDKRNPIDEISDKKKNEAALNQVNTNLENISNKLDDIQAASEMSAESVEHSTNELKNSFDNSLNETNMTLKDLVALGELNLETLSYGMRNIGNISNVISNKLSNIFKTINKNGVSGTSTEDGLKRNLPSPVEPPPAPPAPFEKPEPVKPQPAPTNEKPNNNGNNSNNNTKPNRRPKSRRKSNNQSDINQTLKIGFKALQNNGDKISSFLFDLTISAALNTAKLVMMITAIIFVADVIRMKFEYFSKLFETNFKKFLEMAGKMAPIYEKILAMVSTIKDVFSGKINFMDYLKQINLEYMGLMKNLAFGIEVLLGKAMAGILRYFGNTKLADKIEGGALSDYQKHTGAVLSGSDKKMAAEYDLNSDRENRAGTTYSQASMSAASPLQMAHMNLNSNQLDDPRNRRDYDDKPKEVQIKYMEDKNEVAAKVKSTSIMLDDMSYSATALKSAAPEISDITSSFNKLKAESPDLAASVQPDYDALIKAYKEGGKNNTDNASASAKPDNPKNSSTYISQQNISSLMMDSDTYKRGYLDPSSNNVGVTNVKTVNNNHVYRIDPKTSSSAPGMGNFALGTN